MTQKTCKRCGEAYPYYGDYCDLCGVRNVLDNLNMLTPPGLLDRHTRHPTLTDDEFADRMEKQNIRT